MSPNDQQTRETVLVRRLTPDDVEAIIALDAGITGQRREEYIKLKLAQALYDTGIQVSLAAEIDGSLAGFLFARVYYGEFGITERVAVLDTFGVSQDYTGRGIGRELIRQLRTNLEGLGIQTLQTEVAWDSLDLLSFFHHTGFRPAPRLCLDLDVREARILAEQAEAQDQEAR